MTATVPSAPDRTVLEDKVLTEAVYTATIDAPIEKIDIARWLFTLPDAEYQRCAPPDHKAAGYTTTDDGRPMSINVEMIGTGLTIQHYVAQVAEKHHCHMVSLSDVLTPAGWTTTQVTWCLQAEAVDSSTSTYTNTVTSHPTAEFMQFIEAQGQSWEDAARARQAATDDHCRRETPLYAASIGRYANAQR
ncbi:MULTISPECIES: hypothetical protein [unclassified Geodermatophilus]